MRCRVANTAVRIALFGILSLGALYGCRTPKSRNSDAGTRKVVYRFREAVVPDSVSSPEEQARYYAEHYWDRFGFNDTIFITHVDTAEMIYAYARYASLIRGTESGAAKMTELMQRASASRQMFDYFVMLAEQVLHDPNSPCRDDELYIPVLEAELSSPFYDEYERMAPAYDLSLAKKNRIGHKAGDFRYTLASGRTSNLYSLRSPFVLIYINNPGCPMCKDVQSAISASPSVAEWLASGVLTILAIYPDEDLEAWREYAPTMPAQWINGYDAGCVIRNGDLYDLRAIPSLYLLDAEKRVVVKDSTSVAEIEAAIEAGI